MVKQFLKMKKLLLVFIYFFSWIHYSSAAFPPVVNGQPLPSLAPMLERTTPAVVNIATEGYIKVRENALLSDPVFRHFFKLPRQYRHRKTESLGSGVIVDARKGFILTNTHVIDKASKITVTLNTGIELDAQVVGADPDTDIAVIQVNSKTLTALKMANSDANRVGDFVVAIGNPFGLGQTVTSGIISALGRSGLGIEGYEDFIQTDASINVGNSGGALVNLRGELIGINTAILAPGGGSVGIGFAIPSNMAYQVMRHLVKYGEVKRGSLGLMVQEITSDLASAFKLRSTNGVIITKVKPRSSAEFAGIEVGDVVIAINHKTVRNAMDMRNAFGLHIVGEAINMTLFRNGKRVNVKVVIAESRKVVIQGGRIHPVLKGTILSDINEEINESVSRKKNIQGILIEKVAPYSSAHQFGLRKGDVIIGINNNRITTLKQLGKIKESGQSLALNIMRNNTNLLLMLN